RRLGVSFSTWRSAGERRPRRLAVGPGGELYVADTANDRLVIFTDPLRRNTADRVFGHSDFNAGGNPLSPYVTIPPTTARNLLRPRTLAFDGAGACTWRTRSTT